MGRGHESEVPHHVDQDNAGPLRTIPGARPPYTPPRRSVGLRREVTLSDRRTSRPLDLESQVCFGLSIAARGVVAAYRPLLQPLGLTHPQYLVMVSLWQHGPLTVRRLGELLMLDSGTVSPLVTRLETMGLVRRSRGGSDARQVRVELTDRGERLRAQAEAVHGQVVERLGLSPGQIEQLQRVLEQLIAATDGTTGARTVASG